MSHIGRVASVFGGIYLDVALQLRARDVHSRQRAQLVEAPDVPGHRRLLQANRREVLQEAQYFDGARYLEGK